MTSALVLFSGGQDSTTCLYWAKQTFDYVHALIIDYGQRHRIEIEQAQKIAELAQTNYKVFQTDLFQNIGSRNALTDWSTNLRIHKASSSNEIPNTFVPGRNLIFLNIAAILAYQMGIRNIVGGMCQADYSGYPDCRDDFIRATQLSLQKAFDSSIEIRTPLMFLSKAHIWLLAEELGCLDIVVEHTHTCYAGERKLKRAWGYGCDTCDACSLRKKGFYEAFSIQST